MQQKVSFSIQRLSFPQVPDVFAHPNSKARPGTEKSAPGRASLYIFFNGQDEVALAGRAGNSAVPELAAAAHRDLVPRFQLIAGVLYHRTADKHSPAPEQLQTVSANIPTHWNRSAAS